MNFEEVRQHFEEQGCAVRIYNTVPYRILKVSKMHIEAEYDENEWMKLSEKERIEELENILAEMESIFFQP